jgi:hypothetical protein
MNKADLRFYPVKIGAGVLLLASLTGCFGYVDGGGYVAPVVVGGPEVFFYGGDYGRGRDVHYYSHRGAESRGSAHSGGGSHDGKRR